MDKLCLQLWSVRDYMKDAESIKSTFKKLKEIGYDQVQTAGSPIPYSEMAKLAKEAGIEIVGTHYDFDKMLNDTEGAIEEHKLMGANCMGIGGFFCKTEKEIYEFIEKANTIAARIAKEGMKFTYHNHHGEFQKYGDKTMMQILADGLDKDNTSFVLDTHWVQRGGGDPIEWINKLSGRIDILHLKDMQIIRNENGEVIPAFAEIGSGNMNFKGIMEAAKKAGVKYYCVEQDESYGKDPFECVKASSDYIHKNFM